jgi:hypothetical protein
MGSRAATSVMIRNTDFPERDVSGYATPIRRAFSLSLKSRTTADFVHLFLKVSGDTIIKSE